jgi:hypothetical protein
MGNDQYSIRLSTLEGEVIPPGLNALSNLKYTAVPGKASAFIPVTLHSIQGNQPDGGPVAQNLGMQGRVVYLGAEPLVELLPNTTAEPGQLMLVVYSDSTGTVRVESTLSMVDPVDWQEFWEAGPPSVAEVIVLPMTEQEQAFRVINP